jgi:hypothetical protein
MAGQKNKKYPSKKNINRPAARKPNCPCLGRGSSVSHPPVSVPTPDAADQPLAFRLPTPRANGWAVSARHGIL